jgi:DNA-binding NarL/FixJ family response regulator
VDANFKYCKQKFFCGDNGVDVKKVATFVSPGTNRNVVNCAYTQFPVDLQARNHVEELYPLLSDPTFTTDFVVISVEVFTNRKDHVDMFDIINTLATLIKSTVYRPTPSSKPEHRQTKICVLVDANTDKQLVRELTNFPHVYSIGWIVTKEQDIKLTIEHLNRLLAGDPTHDRRVIDLLKPVKKCSSTLGNTIKLTTRQAQILRLIQERGCSNKQIAKLLDITESTVKLHVGSILTKYGVKNRTQLAVFAREPQK